jgi:hypothetical protein
MNPLLKLEQPLIDLKNMAGLLEHMATSDRAATGQELGHIVDILKECHEDISTVRDAIGLDWPTIPEAADAEVAELNAQLAACEASHAPPGSKADVESAKAYWLLLLSAARTTLAACEEAGVLPVESPSAEEGGAS